jgi:hypothetical protein
VNELIEKTEYVIYVIPHIEYGIDPDRDLDFRFRQMYENLVKGPAR